MDRKNRRALVIEVKWAKRPEDLPRECEAALAQIEEKGYAEGMRTEGFEEILCYGAAFSGKRALVRCGNC